MSQGCSQIFGLFHPFKGTTIQALTLSLISRTALSFHLCPRLPSNRLLSFFQQFLSLPCALPISIISPSLVLLPSLSNVLTPPVGYSACNPNSPPKGTILEHPQTAVFPHNRHDPKTHINFFFKIVFLITSQIDKLPINNTITFPRNWHHAPKFCQNVQP